ncbi:Armadillo-type fold, partial [Trinorchestia longiramus]
VLNLEQSGSSGEVNRWVWLVKAQQSGQLLVKNILYDQWLHNGAFRVFCNQFIKKVIKHTRSISFPGKFWSVLQRKLVQLQEGVCAVLQSQQLLSVVYQLIHAELVAVKLRSLELLRTRLLPSAAFFSEEDSGALLQLLPTLQVLGCNGAEGQDVRLAALCALQPLLSFLGSSILPEQVLPVLQATVDQVTPKGNSPLLVMQTILVVAECVGHVKDESIAVLPRLMPTLLGRLPGSTLLRDRPAAALCRHCPL